MRQRIRTKELTMSDTTKYALSAAIMLAVVAYPAVRLLSFTTDMFQML
jgi:hypothetical protein